MRRGIDWTKLGSGVTKKVDHYIMLLLISYLKDTLNDFEEELAEILEIRPDSTEYGKAAEWSEQVSCF